MIYLVSSIATGLSFDVAWLIVWRMIGGFGIGVSSVVAPMYIAEVAPAKIRGALTSLQQWAITIGIFAFIIPESPRYLLMKGHDDKARKVFSTILAPEDLDSTIEQVKQAIDRENKRFSIKGKALGLQPIIWVGIIVMVLQQFVGINAIFYCSTTLWSSVGFSSDNALLYSVISGAVNVVATIIAILLVDHVGRRPILLTGSAVMAVSLAAMALSFCFAVGTPGKDLSLPHLWGPVALVAANVFVIGFAASWGPLAWVVCSEIFPSHIRAKALAIAACAQWIANVIIELCLRASRCTDLADPRTDVPGERREPDLLQVAAVARQRAVHDHAAEALCLEDPRVLVHELAGLEVTEALRHVVELDHGVRALRVHREHADGLVGTHHHPHRTVGRGHERRAVERGLLLRDVAGVDVEKPAQERVVGPDLEHLVVRGGLALTVQLPQPVGIDDRNRCVHRSKRPHPEPGVVERGERSAREVHPSELQHVRQHQRPHDEGRAGPTDDEKDDVPGRHEGERSGLWPSG